jgi:hypothetical protein
VKKGRMKEVEKRRSQAYNMERVDKIGGRCGGGAKGATTWGGGGDNWDLICYAEDYALSMGEHIHIGK